VVSAALVLTAGAGAAFTPPSGSTASSRPAISRWSGTDRYGTAVAVSQARYPNGADVVYVATGTSFPDALTGAAAAAGRGPVLLVSAAGVPPATSAELHRLAPKRLVVLGGPDAVSPTSVAQAAAAAGGAAVTRAGGADRYATSAAVSAATFGPGVPVAYVATGSDFPDALAASAAAGGKGPVLLAGDVLDPAVASELTRLHPAKLIVAGDTTAVSDDVASDAQAAAATTFMTRVAGFGHYGTPAAVSGAAFTPGAPMVFLATRDNFADGLAAAAASAGRGPLLLVGATFLPNVVAGELRRLQARATVVIGGQASISDNVAALVDAVSAQGIPSASDQAATAVATAKAEVGKPYVWGGAGPDSFDCSGLTQFSWKPAGVSLPHNAADQDDLIASIPVSAVVPGDLLFYGEPVYHVAMYIGGGQMIEAPHTGVPVRIVEVRTQDLADAGRPR